MYRAFIYSKEDIMFSLQDTYDQAIRVSQNIVEDIRFGRKLYLDPVDTCSIQICKYQNNDKDVLTLLNSVKDKYSYLYSHPVNVAFLSLIIGVWLNLSQEKLLNLVRAGLLHDMGKAKIKDSLLNKPEQLTLEEVEKLKSHPVIGYKILNSYNKFEPDVLRGVLFHHERMDGTGYPVGLKGESINVISRIIALADTFDALTSNRAYRKRCLPLDALKEIKETSTNLDPCICRIFINNLINYYCGREILLSNECVGRIVSINPMNITKPLVHYSDENHDLSEETDIEIAEML